MLIPSIFCSRDESRLNSSNIYVLGLKPDGPEMGVALNHCTYVPRDDELMALNRMVSKGVWP